MEVQLKLCRSSDLYRMKVAIVSLKFTFYKKKKTKMEEVISDVDVEAEMCASWSTL